MDDALPASGPAAAAGLGAAGSRRLRRRAARAPCPAALAAAGVDAGDVVGIGTDFTASTPLPVLADGTPLCELDELPRAPARLREAVEAPRGPGAGRPHHRRRGRARRTVAAALRRAHLVGVAVRQGAAAARGGPARSTTRMDRWIEAADWIVWQLCGEETRNVCTAGYKGIHQDEGYPSPEYLAALNAGFAGFVADKLDHPLVAARRARRVADRRGRRAGPACRRASRSRSATSTPTSPRRPPRRSSPASCSRSWARRPAT